MVEDGVGLALPSRRVVDLRQLVEDVLDESASGLACLGLLGPVEHEALFDVLHEFSCDSLDVVALRLRQDGIGLGDSSDLLIAI